MQLKWRQILWVALVLSIVGMVWTSPAQAAGWEKMNNGTWKYADSQENDVTGWQKIDGSWYWFTANGTMASGWLQDGGWYYLDSSTGMVTGWKFIKGSWYYFSPNGRMQTGWIKVDGKWYSMDESSGKMRTGWYKDGQKWYFLHQNPSKGYMLHDTILKENGRFLALDSNGVLVMQSYIYNGVALPVDAGGYIQESQAKELLGDAFVAFDAQAVLIDDMVPPSAKFPYYIEVNKGAQIVTVYTYGADGEYNIPVKYMICSTAKTASNTPEGLFNISNQYRWRNMIGGVFSQYASRIVGGVLFHSIPTKEMDISTMYVSKYNQIGTPASAGCVRLLASEAKWIYDNCPPGTYVRIFTGSPNEVLRKSLLPAALPGSYAIDPSDPLGSNIAPPGSRVRAYPYPGVTPVSVPQKV